MNQELQDKLPELPEDQYWKVHHAGMLESTPMYSVSLMRKSEGYNTHVQTTDVKNEHIKTNWFGRKKVTYTIDTITEKVQTPAPDVCIQTTMLFDADSCIKSLARPDPRYVTRWISRAQKGVPIPWYIPVDLTVENIVKVAESILSGQEDYNKMQDRMRLYEEERLVKIQLLAQNESLYLGNYPA